MDRRSKFLCCALSGPNDCSRNSQSGGCERNPRRRAPGICARAPNKMNTRETLITIAKEYRAWAKDGFVGIMSTVWIRNNKAIGVGGDFIDCPEGFHPGDYMVTADETIYFAAGSSPNGGAGSWRRILA